MFLTLEPTNSVQVNIPAESGDMGVLASHVPAIEQLRPGLVEVFEESGGSKQFFCRSTYLNYRWCFGHECNMRYDREHNGEKCSIDSRERRVKRTGTRLIISLLSSVWWICHGTAGLRAQYQCR